MASGKKIVRPTNFMKRWKAQKKRDEDSFSLDPLSLSMVVERVGEKPSLSPDFCGSTEDETRIGYSKTLSDRENEHTEELLTHLHIRSQEQFRTAEKDIPGELGPENRGIKALVATVEQGQKKGRWGESGLVKSLVGASLLGVGALCWYYLARRRSN